MVPFILVLIILSLFITITPGAFDEKTVLFLALLIAASWHIIRLSTYKIILYDDKMVECLWWRKRNFYYKNIKHIVINGADFDAAKVGECLGAKKVNKYIEKNGGGFYLEHCAESYAFRTSKRQG